jgi:hypothetical protein
MKHRRYSARRRKLCDPWRMRDEHWIGEHDQALHLRSGHCVESLRKLGWLSSLDHLEAHSEFCRRTPRFAHHIRCRRKVRIYERCHARCSGHSLLQKTETLCTKLGIIRCDASHIRTRPCQCRNKTGSDWIRDARQPGKRFVLAVCVALFNEKILPLNIPESLQPRSERVNGLLRIGAAIGG